MSTPVIVLVGLEVVLMIAVPALMVYWLGRRWTLPWRLALAGGVTFVGSQVLHLPANSVLGMTLNMSSQPLPVQAIVLGLSAGIFEEVARYVVYRFWQKDARSWEEAVYFGLGHGGMESALTGLLVALTLVNMVVIAQAPDPTALGLPEGALEQITDFWAMPLYMPLLAVAERLMALVLHVALSTVVALCFARHRIWPLLVAILWHAAVDSLAVYAGQTWGPAVVEGVLALLTLPNVGLIVLMRRALGRRSVVPA